MLKQSFILLERVGAKKEQKIWDAGIHDWDTFLDTKRIRMFSPRSKGFYDRQLVKAKQALSIGDLSYFSQQLPQGEAWRLFNEVRDDTVFLDIETSGYYGSITVIGMYDGKDTMTMVRGQNLDKDLLRKTLARYSCIVTFNGSSFVFSATMSSAP